MILFGSILSKSENFTRLMIKVDDTKKQEIKKVFLFFLRSGYTDKAEIYNKIIKDFQVTKGEMYQIVKELHLEFKEE